VLSSLALVGTCRRVLHSWRDLASSVTLAPRSVLGQE
jgi:hypothetical protein